MSAACLGGAGLTPFGRLEAAGTLELMSRAAHQALDEAGLACGDIDGLLTGYATTYHHLMLATVFAEYSGLQPVYSHGLQVGSATELTMVDEARRLV